MPRRHLTRLWQSQIFFQMDIKLLYTTMRAIWYVFSLLRRVDMLLEVPRLINLLRYFTHLFLTDNLFHRFFFRRHQTFL